MKISPPGVNNDNYVKWCLYCF